MIDVMQALRNNKKCVYDSLSVRYNLWEYLKRHSVLVVVAYHSLATYMPNRNFNQILIIYLIYFYGFRLDYINRNYLTTKKINSKGN